MDHTHDPLPPATTLLERDPELAQAALINAGVFLQHTCHGLAKASGWWHKLGTNVDLTIPNEDGTFAFNVPEKLCLIHSEVSEAMEGYRKNLPDDKLPHRPMIEVELADTLIRVFDLAGAMGLDLPGAIAEKLLYNSKRADHKPENRLQADGKKF